MQQLLVSERIQEFHEVFSIGASQQKSMQYVGLVGMVESSARGVVVDHFVEGRYAAIVHVG